MRVIKRDRDAPHLRADEDDCRPLEGAGIDSISGSSTVRLIGHQIDLVERRNC